MGILPMHSEAWARCPCYWYMKESSVRLAVLVSGGGTTLQNFIDEIFAGRLDGRIELVVGSAPNLRGISRAVDVGLPTQVIERSKFDSTQPFSDAVFERIDQANVDLVLLAGWLKLLVIPDRYAGRVMNIHPALLPSFGGKGMYGSRVHQAVIDRGCKVSGCTVHFVDNDYDNGPIILQRTCEVLDSDTATSLAERVFEQEKIAYPQAVHLWQEKRITIVERRVNIAVL